MGLARVALPRFAERSRRSSFVVPETAFEENDLHVSTNAMLAITRKRIFLDRRRQSGRDVVEFEPEIVEVALG